MSKIYWAFVINGTLAAIYGHTYTIMKYSGHELFGKLYNAHAFVAGFALLVLLIAAANENS
ncbi:MAG: hypothetical protein IPI97_14530 [Nitrosomonas sp.]|nr:hypothetical protein [Nitrosomonas sp.]